MSNLKQEATWLYKGDRMVATITIGDNGYTHHYGVECNGCVLDDISAETFVSLIDDFSGGVKTDGEHGLETAGLELYLALGEALTARSKVMQSEAKAFSTIMDTMGRDPETSYINH